MRSLTLLRGYLVFLCAVTLGVMMWLTFLPFEGGGNPFFGMSSIKWLLASNIEIDSLFSSR